MSTEDHLMDRWLPGLTTINQSWTPYQAHIWSVWLLGSRRPLFKIGDKSGKRFPPLKIKSKGGKGTNRKFPLSPTLVHLNSTFSPPVNWHKNFSASPAEFGEKSCQRYRDVNKNSSLKLRIFQIFSAKFNANITKIHYYQCIQR